MIGAARHHLVDRHFAGVEADPRRLFRHLRGCERCRQRYHAHALLEALEPDGETRARDRLGRAFFPAVAARAPWRRWLLGGLGAALAAAMVLLVARPGDSVRPRGSSAQTAGPSLTLYRVPPGRPPERAGAVFKAGEALAFSYANPRGERALTHLMVFAVDARGRVFWFWPAWQDVATNPAALPITTSPRPVELGEAVRHALAPGPLTVVGLFGGRAFTVREVEAALAGGEAGLAALGGETWSERVEVLP